MNYQALAFLASVKDERRGTGYEIQVTHCRLVFLVPFFLVYLSPYLLVYLFPCFPVYLLSRNTRLNPQGAITGGVAKRKDRDYELDILPSQRTEIEINSEVFAIVLFAKCPEVTDESIGELIVHAQEHAAGGGAEFAADDRLEAVSIFYFEGWIDRADISIALVFRD